MNGFEALPPNKNLTIQDKVTKCQLGDSGEKAKKEGEFEYNWEEYEEEILGQVGSNEGSGYAAAPGGLRRPQGSNKQW